MLNDLDSLPPHSLRDLAAYLRKLAEQISNHADLLRPMFPDSMSRQTPAITQASNTAFPTGIPSNGILPPTRTLTQTSAASRSSAVPC